MLPTISTRAFRHCGNTSLRHVFSSKFVSSTSSARATSDEDLTAARQWLAQFNPETIPKSVCEVSFSRSSGPGGQNVNKVNSKATLRVPASVFLPLIPTVLHPHIQAHRYYAKKSASIIIQADDSRKQSENVQTCFQRLHSVVIDAGRCVIPGETSVEQKERVKGLQKAQNESRLRLKKTHSSKKSARRDGRSSGDY